MEGAARRWQSMIGSTVQTAPMPPSWGVVTDAPRPDAPSARRVNAAAKLLAGHPEDVLRVLDRLDANELANVGEAIRQLQRRRALARGDLDAIIANGFEVGFGRDGLGLLPWIEGDVVVCPGGLIAKSRTNHRCRFVSVDDTWIWDSGELIREDKRSTPGCRRRLPGRRPRARRRRDGARRGLRPRSPGPARRGARRVVRDPSG